MQLTILIYEHFGSVEPEGHLNTQPAGRWRVERNLVNPQFSNG